MSNFPTAFVLGKGMRPICTISSTLCWLLLTPFCRIALAAQTTIDIVAIAAAASKSIVLINGSTDSGRVLGSGFILTADGKIVTNLHVIEMLKTGGVQVATGDIFDSFTVIAFDKRKDLAIIQVAGFDLPTLQLGNSNEINVGEPVIALGNPLGLRGTVTAGILSSVREDPDRGFKVIQTDVAVNPGNSGGPLVNGRGQAIGVISWKVSNSEGLNFAVPINYVRGMLNAPQQPLSLDAMRLAIANSKDTLKTDSVFPLRWKSLKSGTTNSLRFQGDFIYGDLELTETAKSVGEFATYELKKQDEGYSGFLRMGYNCRYQSWEVRFKQCRLEEPIELTTVTTVRIEGRIKSPPSNAKFDCKKCEHSKPFEWGNFVWIPQN